MIILGLGCNLGDREQNLALTIKLLEENLLRDIQKSSIYKTPAMMPPNAPVEWNIEFFNMAICGELKQEISPESFLAQLKQIEKTVGRKPSERWAPREIDIDILAWNNLLLENDNLDIPHKALHKRDFAYKPFLELSPNWEHPKFKKKLSEIVR